VGNLQKALKKRPEWQASDPETMVDVCHQIEDANEEFGAKATALTSFIVGVETWFRGLKYQMPSMIDAASEDGSKIGFQRLPGNRWGLVVARGTTDGKAAMIPLATAPLVLKVAVAGKIPQLIKQHREQQLVLIAEIDNLASTIEEAKGYGIFEDSSPEEFSAEGGDDGPK
jgi:hypothetical protein